MIIKTNNGDVEIKTKELDFTNLMCDIEDNGVDIMALMSSSGRDDMKVFNTMRALLAALIGTKDLRSAGRVLSEHIKNGGDINVIMNVFMEAMESAGFGAGAKKQAQKTEEPETAEETKTELTSDNTNPTES